MFTLARFLSVFVVSMIIFVSCNQHADSSSIVDTESLSISVSSELDNSEDLENSLIYEKQSVSSYEKNGLKFDYPSHWTILDQQMDDSYTVFFSEKDTVRMSVEMGEAWLADLDLTKKDFEFYTNDVYEQLKMLEYDKMKIQDYDAIHIKYSFIGSGKEWKDSNNNVLIKKFSGVIPNRQYIVVEYNIVVELLSYNISFLYAAEDEVKSEEYIKLIMDSMFISI